MTDITVTEEAIRYIQKQLAKRGKGIGMRLSVKDAGCTGKKYVVDFIDESKSDDLIYPISKTHQESATNNLILCVDPISFIYVAGTEIDYEKKGLMGKLVFHNPNEKAACGCGESFHV